MGGPAALSAVGGRPKASWKTVALPTEHGGWGLTFEPALLGLLVRPGTPAVLLGLAGMLAFVARTPLKLALVDRWRGRSLPRTALARRIASCELVALALVLAGAWRVADGPFWVPLAAALPLLGLELWFDMRSRGRRLTPELAGTVGIGSIAAATVMGTGGGWALALGLWTVIAARGVASLPFAHAQLGRSKQQRANVAAAPGSGIGKGAARQVAAAHDVRRSDLAQVVALAAVVAGALAGAVPVLGVVAVAGLVAFHLVASRRPAPRAPIVGVQQLALGVVVVVVTAIGAG
jgi:hypothetical protein